MRGLTHHSPNWIRGRRNMFRFIAMLTWLATTVATYYYRGTQDGFAVSTMAAMLLAACYGAFVGLELPLRDVAKRPRAWIWGLVLLFCALMGVSVYVFLGSSEIDLLEVLTHPSEIGDNLPILGGVLLLPIAAAWAVRTALAGPQNFLHRSLGRLMFGRKGNEEETPPEKGDQALAEIHDAVTRLCVARHDSVTGGGESRYDRSAAAVRAWVEDLARQVFTLTRGNRNYVFRGGQGASSPMDEILGIFLATRALETGRHGFNPARPVLVAGDLAFLGPFYTPGTDFTPNSAFRGEYYDIVMRGRLDLLNPSFRLLKIMPVIEEVLRVLPRDEVTRLMAGTTDGLDREETVAQRMCADIGAHYDRLTWTELELRILYFPWLRLGEMYVDTARKAQAIDALLARYRPADRAARQRWNEISRRHGTDTAEALKEFLASTDPADLKKLVGKLRSWLEPAPRTAGGKPAAGHTLEFWMAYAGT